MAGGALSLATDLWISTVYRASFNGYKMNNESVTCSRALRKPSTALSIERQLNQDCLRDVQPLSQAFPGTRSGWFSHPLEKRALYSSSHKIR
jgi:hypothetical protein